MYDEEEELKATITVDPTKEGKSKDSASEEEDVMSSDECHWNLDYNAEASIESLDDCVLQPSGLRKKELSEPTGKCMLSCDSLSLVLIVLFVSGYLKLFVKYNIAV